MAYKTRSQPKTCLLPSLVSTDNRVETAKKLKDGILPIYEIFMLEGEALGRPVAETNRLLRLYEDYIIAFDEGMDIGCRAFSKGSTREGLPEEKVFTAASEIFHLQQEHGFKRDTMLSTAISPDGSVSYNCSSSAAIIYHACTLRGLDVKIATTGSHMFIVGKKWAFETTADPENALLPRKDIAALYPYMTVGGVELLLANAYRVAAYATNAKRAETGSALAPAIQSSVDKELLRRVVSYLESAKKYNSTTPDIRLALGGYCLQQGRYEKTLAEFKEALRLRPTHEPCRRSLFRLGMFFECNARYNEALDAFSSVRAADPGNPSVLNAITVVLHKQAGEEDSGREPTAIRVAPYIPPSKQHSPTQHSK